MNASVVLTSAMSKRLIAKGVAAHPSVISAMRSGRIVVTLGTTNALVAEELLGRPVDRGTYAAGFVDTRWNMNRRLNEASEVVLEDGRQVTGPLDDVPSSLKAGDVVIKGGNCLDPFGTVGVLMAASGGGTIGRYIAAALARGVSIVVPISVAKSVHSIVPDLSTRMGTGQLALHMGLACGLYPLHGCPVTELEAFRLLCDVEAVHVASGGVGAGQGSVSLLLSGEDEAVRDAFSLVESLSGEAEIDLQGRA